MLLFFSVFMVIYSFGESVDPIRPNETTISSSEGSRTTLSCIYDGTPYRLHWAIMGSQRQWLAQSLELCHSI
ncbi:hypothetical protein AOLI_G00113650 [Acnodon oligacanthus]